MKRLFLAIVAILIAGLAIYFFVYSGRHHGVEPAAEMQMSSISSGETPDLNTEKMTEKGLYRARFEPAASEPEIGPMAVWNLTLTTPAGDPVENARIVVDGSMPSHGHGLPTAPAVTEVVGPGIYAIDGVRFSMAGWWQFVIEIDAAQGKDRVTFNVTLSP